MQDMADKKTAQFTFRTTDEVLNELKRLAKLEDRDVAWVVNRALQDWLAWRSPGSYDAAAGITSSAEAAEIARMWTHLAPSQRRLIRDMMKSGAHELRDNADPILNEKGGGY